MMPAERTMPGMLISRLLQGVVDLGPAQDLPVTSISMDSRDAARGGLFLACSGGSRHGLEFLRQALAKGVAAVLWETGNGWGPDRVRELAPDSPVPLIEVRGLSGRVSRIAGRFYADPSEGMAVFGVTGTNGKTSCTQFLAEALAPDLRCGVVGTLGSGFPNDLVAGTHTTPDPVALQAALADLRTRGAGAVAMEVSSHALDQGRAAAVRFEVAVLTNLSRDHLDYHGTMTEYAAAKGRLFQMPGLACAVLNMDDPFGRQLATELPAELECVGYGQDGDVDRYPGGRHWVRAVAVASDETGMRIQVESSWGAGQFATSLLGRFNVSNLLAVLSVLLYRGVPLPTALDRLARMHTVPGRMERFGGGERPLVVVDYAHTPDALEHALGALLGHTRGRLVCVVGCGGDRDRGKRPQMGGIAESLAAKVIVTDDNPRSEDGDRIVAEILAGMSHPAEAEVIRDRSRAISTAVGHARAGDVVLVAGKGHETTQQVGATKLPFSDRDQVAAVLRTGQ